MAEAFLDALHADFLEHGVAAIEAARTESPLGYVRIVAGLLPQKLDLTSDVDHMTDEELLAIIRRVEGELTQLASDEAGGPVH